MSKSNGKKSQNQGAQGQLLRRLPQVDRLLALDEFQPLIRDHSRAEVTLEVRNNLDRLRAHGSQGKLKDDDVKTESILARVEAGLLERARPYYLPVINATGIVLHTGLGRAPIADEVVSRLAERVGHPLRVEIDLESGDRGGRERGCAQLLEELTGCEAATVVNNNAGATLLILAALARGSEVLLSRGEMVEIGGSYRVPDIMEESGAQLVDVGTTNRTHLHDYERAITENTGMILKVHTSNYVVQGFTKEVEIDELVRLGREHDIPVVHDLGSGCLLDLSRYGVRGEPYVPESVRSGADLICFSGDKLLGGPQAGIILGSREQVARCQKHPLYRALRPGRLTYVALESTLRIYREGEAGILEKIPALRRITARPEVLRKRADALAASLSGLSQYQLEVVACSSLAGSGSLPTRELASWGVRLAPREGSVAELARHLRRATPPILTRSHDDALMFDLRTLEDSDFPQIRSGLESWG